MLRRWRKAEKAALLLLVLLTGILLTSLQKASPAEPRAIYFVEGSPARVALTFETLWTATGLEAVLQVLHQEGVHATFFLSGTWLKQNPELAWAILAGGHEIGNHTMNHRVMLDLNSQDMVKEIKAFNELAAEILEYRPRLFRPPLGLYSGAVLKKARQLGCRTVLWSVDSYDWTSRSSAEILGRVSGRLHGGAIMVFRIGAPLLPEALAGVLTELRSRGYKAVTVTELLQTEN
ncbi:MAG: polysaccharide deacetylase family protein [Bacillota bacterium]